MEAIFRLSAAVPVPLHSTLLIPSFPTGLSGRRRAARLQGAAVPVACASDPAYLSRGAAATPLPWSTRPAVRSSTKTAAGGGDGSPGSMEDFLKKRDGHAKKDGDGKDVKAKKVRDSTLGEAVTATTNLPLPSEALTAILPLEKRFELLELLINHALPHKNEEGIMTKSHVSSKDWLSNDQKLAAGFALSLAYSERKEYAKAKQVLEKLLRHEASSDASRVPFFLAALLATMLALEIHLPKGKRS